MTFLLIGHLWWIGPGRVDYNDDIEQEIKAANIVDAVEKAKGIIKEALKKDGCPHNCNVACDLYELSYKIGTNDMWNVMDRKNYKSGNHISTRAAV